MPSEVPMNPRKTPRQERSRETVDAILGATAQVLVREGYGRASTRRIAEVAGYSIGSLYQYFPNKQALVAALLERHLEGVMGVFRSKLAELEGASLPEAVGELVEAFIRAHAVNPELHRVLVEQVPRYGDLARLESVGTRIAGLVREYLEGRREELRPKDPELAAFVVVQAVESLTHAAVLKRPEYLADGRLAEEATTLVLRYLAPGA